MKTRRFPLWLSCVAMLLACLMLLTACGENGVKPNVTTDTGVSDNTSVEEKLVYPEACDDHHGDFICENCGNRMTPNNFFEKFCETDKTWTLVLEDISVTIPNNTNYTYVDEEAESSTLTIKKGELSLTFDGTNINGYGVITDAVYTTEYTTVNVSGTATIKDNVVYADLSTAIKNYQEADVSTDAVTATSAGKVKELYSTDDKGIHVYFTLDYLVDAVIMQSDFADISSQIGDISDAALEQVENGLLLMAKAIVTMHPELEDMVARIADLFFTVTKSDDGYEIVLSTKKLGTLNDTFAEMTVAGLVDYVVGEGSYDLLVAYINASYNKTVSQLLTELKAQGIDVVAILTLCKALVPADTETHPILDALKQLSDETFLNTTVKALIISGKDEDTAVTDDKYFENVKEEISATFAGMKELTVWDAVANIISNFMPAVTDVTDSDETDDTDDSEFNGTAIHDMISSVLKMLGDEGVVLTVDTTLNGTLKSVALAVAIPNIATGKLSLLSDYKTTADLDAVVTSVSADVAVIKTNADEIVKALSDFYTANDKYATIEYNKETGIATITMNSIATTDGEPLTYTFNLTAPTGLAYEKGTSTNSDETRTTNDYIPVYRSSTSNGDEYEDNYYDFTFRIEEDKTISILNAD